MPSQQVEVAEAIAGIKRALKREREAPSDEPVVAASNRGNKLQKGAKFVHEGALIHVSGPEVYKEKIEHAGYTRYILDRNPRRYNEYGEELDDSETDEEADADATDQNAYSGIRLEELLCPLKHPSELPIHPTMSHAYLSSALPDMVSSTHEKLRQERASLWRAKYLNRQLTGDASWIPAGEMETSEDWNLFEPRNQGGHMQPSRKRKRHGEEHKGQNGNHKQLSDEQSERNGVSKATANVTQDDFPARKNGAEGAIGLEMVKNFVTDAQAVDDDVVESEEVANATKDGSIEAENVSSKDAVVEGTVDLPERPEPNGVDRTPTEQHVMGEEIEQQGHPRKGEDGLSTDLGSKAEPAGDAADQVSHPASDDVSPPPPPRRITRALAANNNSNSHSNAPTPPLSPASSSTTTSSSSQLQIDPLYLVPPSANPYNSAMAFHGLLPEEAVETRRLLTLYIQKQEESVRGYEAILSKLLTAQRLRTEVLEMCKTEEHVGELSDGEDWIDAERWGLLPGELRKGRDEDEDVMDENTIGGRKGKRRARN